MNIPDLQAAPGIHEFRPPLVESVNPSGNM
jgi:hypothetical protein